MIIEGELPEALLYKEIFQLRETSLVGLLMVLDIDISH